MSEIIYFDTEILSEILGMSSIGKIGIDVSEHSNTIISSWNKGIPMPDDTKKILSDKMKIVNAENDYWKKGVKSASEKLLGSKQTIEHKSKKSKKLNLEIEIDGITYSSGKEAAAAFNVVPSAISQWAKKNGSRYGIISPTGSNQYVNRCENKHKQSQRSIQSNIC